MQRAVSAVATTLQQQQQTCLHVCSTDAANATLGWETACRLLQHNCVQSAIKEQTSKTEVPACQQTAINHSNIN